MLRYLQFVAILAIIFATSEAQKYYQVKVSDCSNLTDLQTLGLRYQNQEAFQFLKMDLDPQDNVASATLQIEQSILSPVLGYLNLTGNHYRVQGVATLSQTIPKEVSNEILRLPWRKLVYLRMNVTKAKCLGDLIEGYAQDPNADIVELNGSIDKGPVELVLRVREPFLPKVVALLNQHQVQFSRIRKGPSWKKWQHFSSWNLFQGYRGFISNVKIETKDGREVLRLLRKLREIKEVDYAQVVVDAGYKLVVKMKSEDYFLKMKPFLMGKRDTMGYSRF